MAFDETRRLRPAFIQADRNSFSAMQALPDYDTVDPAFAVAALADRLAAMEAAQSAELHARNVLNAARDAANSAEWAFHNAVLGAKQQVVARYGPDSDAVQALGLTKKSQRKRPKRRTKNQEPRTKNLEHRSRT